MASTSVFVSCKDYDDDISNLQEQINKKSEITALESAQTALKAEITSLKGQLQTEDTRLATLIATKANLSDLDAAIATLQNSLNGKVTDLDAKIATLQTSLSGKANQADLDAANDIINGMLTTLNAKASQADVDAAIAALQAALSGKADKSELEAELAKLQTSLDGKASKAELDAAVAALQNAIDGKANKSEVEAALAALQNSLNEKANKVDVDAAIAALQNMLDVKANKTDLDAVNAALQAEITRALAAESALTSRISAAENTLTSLQTLVSDLQNNKLDKATYETAVAAIYARLEAVESGLGNALTSIETLKNGLSEEKTARIAAEQNLQNQLNALDEFKNKVNTIYGDYLKAEDKAELLSKIEALEADINAIKTSIQTEEASINTLKTQMAEAQRNVSNVAADVDVLTVLVNRILTSISLVPDLYVGGIEAIEFRSLQYQPANPGTSGLSRSGANILIDNGTAEATYRLNPATVKREQIDEFNISFLAAQAETRSVVATSPVKFNGIKSYDNGLMTVLLKKNTTSSLNLTGNKIWIVALNVPRKADAENKVEAANIVSENSRLVENTFTPRIARLPWNPSNTYHHYSDSAAMWNSNVDASPLQMVYQEVYYDETFDVLAHVTGCYGSHYEINRNELKAYGLEFRFAIPTKEYKKTVDHSTDQQQFAQIDPITGIVSSKLPNGVTDNRACVGKEPIIRIMLVDVVNNKLVDERYMKIKWIEKTKTAIDLGKYTSENVLDPCNDNTQDIKWQKFINDVYAKAEVNGLSQSVFETVYPVANVVYGAVTMNPANSTPATVLQAISTSPSKPVVANTTNENGDALIATWTLTPQEIARIYPSQSKTFTCVITFKSSLPTEYPDLSLTWEWTIKLPALPAINGYYDNYWFTQYELHDVMPVQYNTALYNQIAAGTEVPQGGTLETYNAANNTVAPGTPYCVYYNNLMNAFTYEQVGGAPRFIVKGLTTCGTWDMQFTKAGSDRLDNSKTYTQFAGYAPIFAGNSPLLNRGDDWNIDPAYRLNKTSNNKQALQLRWDDGHLAWCGNPSHQKAILYADHNNAANQALINPLAATNEADGRTPQRTHDKKIHMGIWATLNDWNVIPVKDYDICLVAPLRIDAQLDGAFEEGYVSGTAVSCADAFALTDFRGYTVAQVNGTTEWTKYATALWNYYEVGNPQWDLNNVKYGMQKVGQDVKANPTATYTTAMTAAQISAATNGNIVLSVEMWLGTDGVEYLVFRNNGGSNVEEEVNIFIPVTVTYGFGSVTEYCKATLYPKGNAGSANIVPFIGGTKIAPLP